MKTKNKFAIIILILLFGLTGVSGSASSPFTPSELYQGAKVLICNTSASYAYHSYTCSGLKRCSREVLEISKAEAQKKGRTPCKICYR
ncbi:hypothetical protein BH09BAC1_BH09BAC1_03820 [soil metagenome]